MQKSLISLLLILLLLCSGYSFSVLNTQDREVNYFSSDSPLLNIKHNTNESITMYYQSQNQTNQTETIELNKCGIHYCYNFSAEHYTQYNNSFTIELNSTNKSFIKDNQNPNILNFSHYINKSKKNLELEFKSFDNSGKISRFEIYKKENGDFVYRDSLLNKTQYNLSLTSSQELEILLLLQDEALNTYELSKEFRIDDIFEPQLEHYTIIKDESNNYVLNFSATDESLREYVIYKNSNYIGGKVNTSSITKTINLPFTKGTITLQLIDANENVFEKNISLNSDIDLSSFDTFTNNQEYEFNSNAQTCKITRLNKNRDLIEFSKSGEEFFAKSLDFIENQNNTIKFFCEKDNYREYFSKKIFYDTSPPKDVYLTAEKLDNGNLELSWNESQDKETRVKYNIIKDNQRYKTTSNLEYVDTQVEYPQIYTYQVIPFDKARNEGSSNEVSIKPKKVSVALSFNNSNKTTSYTNKTSLTINTEENANISIEIKNNDNTTYTNSYKAYSPQMNFMVPLTLGANEITITAQDNVSNTKTIRKYVFYEQQQTQGKELEQTQQTLSNQTSSSNLKIQNTSTQSKTIKDDDTINNWWIWLLVFLIALGIFLWTFVFNEEKLRRMQARKIRKEALNSRKRKDDEILGKTLNRVKQRRIEKQHQAAEKKKRQEEQKRRETILSTKYQQNKHKDIAESSQKEVDFNTKKKKKTNKKHFTRNYGAFLKKTPQKKHNMSEKSESFKQINKDLDEHLRNNSSKNTSSKKQSLNQEKHYEEKLETTKSDKPKQSFREKILSKKQQPQKQDDFLEYITKKQSTRGWNSTNSYRQSYHDKKEAQRKEKEAEEQKKNQQEEEKKLKQEQEQQNTQQQDQLSRESSQKKSWFKKSTPKKEDKLSLDDYLSKRSKKKRMYFAEKEIEKKLND